MTSFLKQLANFVKYDKSGGDKKTG